MLHKVTVPEDALRSCLPCRVNPMHLICTCKGSRKIGICSHIIAVNHRCGYISIKSELTRTAKRQKRKHATKKKQATRRNMMQGDSSAEEEGSAIDSGLSNHETSSEEDH